MSIYIPWLADAAKMTGYPVVEESGWRTRGHSGFRVVEGTVYHHTAGGSYGDYPSRNILLLGHGSLKGPLCNYGLARSGTIYVIAAGVGYHAGVSAWAGFTNLNDEFVGIEAENNGSGNWTKEQLDAYPRLVSAILYYIRRDESRSASHRSVAKPAGRKNDPARISDEWMKGQVRNYLSDPSSITKSGGSYERHVEVAPGERVIKLYSNGSDVLWVQTFLSMDAPDGLFGPNTEDAVTEYQKSVGLGPAGLGVIGPNTWGEIFKPYAGQAEYIVRSDDTLPRIAAEIYGNAKAWPTILEANPKTLGGDPKISLGTTLWLPDIPTDWVEPEPIVPEPIPTPVVPEPTPEPIEPEPVPEPVQPEPTPEPPEEKRDDMLHVYAEGLIDQTIVRGALKKNSVETFVTSDVNAAKVVAGWPEVTVVAVGGPAVAKLAGAKVTHTIVGRNRLVTANEFDSYLQNLS